MNKFYAYGIYCGILFTLISGKSFSQDGHYWSENYGNKSVLLSGTVNASVSDLGTVFYNPGRLGLIESPAFVINAQAYEWRTVRIEDGINDGVDLTKSKFGSAPSLVAGTFSIPFLKGHKFAYAFLTRQRLQTDFFVRVEDKGDIVDVITGEEIFNGKLNFNTNFKDEWIGLTWSPPVSKKVGIGLSTFISTVNKSSTIGLDLNTLDERNKVASFTINRQYGYNSYGILWKLGLAFDYDKLNLGLTVTTPRVNLHGSGQTLFEDYMVNVDTTGDGNSDDAFIFNAQENLDVKYRSPWAIGFGVGIPFSKGIIHLSAEWYNKVPRYSILEIEPFIGQSTNETIPFILVHDLEAVINYGIGLELNLNDKLSAFVSFSTDNSGVTSEITRFAELDIEASNSIFQSDFYKFGGGFTISSKNVDVTIGATYASASQEIERPINFPDDGADNIFNSNTTSTLGISQWQFILGLSFPFTNKLKEDLAGDEK